MPDLDFVHCLDDRPIPRHPDRHAKPEPNGQGVFVCLVQDASPSSVLRTAVDQETPRTAPSWQAPLLRRTALPWAPPAAIAPLSDGDEVAITTQQVLLAATQLADVRLDLRAGQGQWSWQGCLDDSFELDDKLILRAANMTVVVDPGSVIALSYCANRHSSGISLCDSQGELLVLWSTDILAFDAWLTALTPPMTEEPCGRSLLPEAATS